MKRTSPGDTAPDVAAPPAEVIAIRAPTLLGQYGKARLPWPGGCRIGDRGMEQHFRVYEAFGDRCATHRYGYEIQRSRTEQGTVSVALPFRSRGATIVQTRPRPAGPRDRRGGSRRRPAAARVGPCGWGSRSEADRKRSVATGGSGPSGEVRTGDAGAAVSDRPGRTGHTARGTRMRRRSPAGAGPAGPAVVTVRPEGGLRPDGPGRPYGRERTGRSRHCGRRTRAPGPLRRGAARPGSAQLPQASGSAQLPQVLLDGRQVGSGQFLGADHDPQFGRDGRQAAAGTDKGVNDERGQ